MEPLLELEVVEDIFPILLYKGANDPRAALAGRTVRFRSVEKQILAYPCGKSLRDVLATVAPSALQRREVGRVR